MDHASKPHSFAREEERRAQTTDIHHTTTPPQKNEEKKRHQLDLRMIGEGEPRRNGLATIIRGLTPSKQFCENEEEGLGKEWDEHG